MTICNSSDFIESLHDCLTKILLSIGSFTISG